LRSTFADPKRETTEDDDEDDDEDEVRLVFDHERLDVYQLELQFIAWGTDLIEEVQERRGRKVREVCDQLDRASISAILNTAEGNGKRQRQVRAKFFDDARDRRLRVRPAWTCSLRSGRAPLARA